MTEQDVEYYAQILPPTFDPDHVKGTIESLVRYMDACGVKQYEFVVCGWSVKMRERRQ